MSSGCGDVLSLEDLKTAKKHQVFEAEVITGKAGGVASGDDIDYATNQVTGQTQKTLPAILRDAGFRPASFDFTTGGTLGANDRDVLVYDPVSKAWYSWKGVLPHVIAASTNPVGDANWSPWTDPTLRDDLASDDGYTLIGGLAEHYGWPSNTIIVDRPPYNGSLAAALAAVPTLGNYTLLLGPHSTYDTAGITNTKPNVAIVGGGMPKADMTTKTLVAGSGTILRGYIVNNAAGFVLYNLGIDNSDTVRTSLLSGAYADAYCNENFGTNAGIQYGNLVIMQADTSGGTVGLRHGIRSEWGSGVRQIGDIFIYMGYHGHVVKCTDFSGTTWNTYCQGTHADGAIIKADTGTGAVNNIRFGNLYCDGGDPASDPIATTGGLVLEAAGAALSDVSIGDIIARNARYACITADTTTTYISNVKIGTVTATNCADGSNILTTIRFSVWCVNVKMDGHNVRNCPLQMGVQVQGSSTASGPNSNSVHIGDGQSCNNLKGYDLAGGVTHGALYSEGNTGYGVDFHGYTGPGSTTPTFSGIGVNQALISGRANGSGNLSAAPSAISSFLGTYTDALSFRCEIIGNTVRISGALAKGATNQANAVQMLGHALPASSTKIACVAQNTSSTVPLYADLTTEGVLTIPQYLSAESVIIFNGEYRIK